MDGMTRIDTRLGRQLNRPSSAINSGSSSACLSQYRCVAVHSHSRSIKAQSRAENGALDQPLMGRGPVIPAIIVAFCQDRLNMRSDMDCLESLYPHLFPFAFCICKGSAIIYFSCVSH